MGMQYLLCLSKSLVEIHKFVGILRLHLFDLHLPPLRCLSLLLQHFSQAIELLSVLSAVCHRLLKLVPGVVDFIVHSAERADSVQVLRCAPHESCLELPRLSALSPFKY